MFEVSVHPAPGAVRQRAYPNDDDYQRLCRQFVENPGEFWGGQAKALLDWSKSWHNIHHGDLKKGQVTWFRGGQLNVAYNCIGRRLECCGEQTAIIWEGDNLSESAHITYCKPYHSVCRLANVLRGRGVKKGDRVCIYIPMIPEAAYAMFTCVRVGVVHSVVFGDFSPDSLCNRVLDADCRAVITADEGVRGSKYTPLKQNVEKVLKNRPDVSIVAVVERTQNDTSWVEGRDIQYHKMLHAVPADCPAETMGVKDPLFILYTSDSIGKPKGMLHTTGGCLLGAAMTHKYVFDYHDGSVYRCTVGIGWVTEHSYIVCGSLVNGTITLMFEGVLDCPDALRFWQMIDKYQMNIFYTMSTATRVLMRGGDVLVRQILRNSLRLLGSMGKPTDPEAWEWYCQVVSEKHCPIVDAWWQIETSNILITPLSGATALKPSSATHPFFGVQPVLLDKKGKEIDDAGNDVLAVKASWPSQVRSVYGDHQRVIDIYFEPYPGYYLSGDDVRRDEDGCYQITGRVDDMINASGHRIDTAGVESTLALHDVVAEAAVIGCLHDVKGQVIYAFVTLMAGGQPSEALQQELLVLVGKKINGFTKPGHLQ